MEWILNDENQGFTGDNHQGTLWELNHGYDYLFFLNRDTQIDPKATTTLVTISKKTGGSLDLRVNSDPSRTHRRYSY